MYENCADRLSNNLRQNEISILIFFPFYCKINKTQLKIVLKATYGLNPYEFFEILNLKCLGRSLLTKRFGFLSNSRGADEIKELPISIHFNTFQYIRFNTQKHGFVTSVQYYNSMVELCLKLWFESDWFLSNIIESGWF